MSKPCGPSHGAQLLEKWRGESTQAEAARLLDVDEASYSRFENGVRRPSGEILVRIERLTDGRVTALSWYEPPIKQKTAKAS